MKTILLFSLLFSLVAMADTPPPGTVKAKMYSGDGLNPVTVTDGAISVNLGGTTGFTVDQGDAGSQSWLASITSSALPTNACQETGGNLAAILSKLQASVAVTGTFWQATQPVSGTVTANAGTGTMLVDGSAHTQPVSGTFWQATQPVSGTITANAGTGTFTVDASGFTVPVSGTFWQTTQPVSGTVTANLGTIAGVSTAANQLTLISALGSPFQAGGSIGNSSFGISGTLPAYAATPTFNLGTLNGAATAAKQPALGTAGTPSADVITVQGAASMTAIKTDGSATTQPVSGTVTANAGTGTFTVDASGHTVPVSGTFWQATQPVSGTVTANIGTSGSLALDSTVAGLQVAQGSTTSGQVGSLAQAAVTTAAPSYTTATTRPFSLTTAGALRIDGSAATQPVSGTFWQATQPVSGTFWQATQPVSLTTLPALTAGSAVIGHVIVDTAPTTAVTGTFWQATQPVSIATAPALVASSAIIGKVGIDQTTPGTTNGVQVNAALPAGSNVIGHVIVDTAPSTAVTNAGTFAVQATPVVAAATTVKQAAITIGTSAVRLTTDGSAPSSTRTLLVAQLLSSSTANCYFGSSGVTSSSTGRGVQMFAGQTFSFNNDAGDYYAICDTTSQTFFITEQE